MKRPLSKRQKSILSYIKEFMSENSYPPTVRDIQSGCDISSTSVVDYNLQILQREGHLQRRREVSRGIELTGAQPEPSNISYLRVPVVGSIAAGEPLNLLGTDKLGDGDFDQVDIPPILTGGKENVFALKVKGESMIDALVGDGDMVFLEPVDHPENGDMVAAWIQDREETTLKHFYLDGDKVKLVPANSQMEPIVVAADNISIKGRVVGVMRTL